MTASVMIHKVKQETPTVTSLIFDKPADFIFQPGQYLNIKIPIQECDNRCNRRNSSIVSSPLDPYLQITMRHGVSRYKQTLITLTVGTEVKIMGPFGRFVLNEDPTIPAVLLSGGIGITPLHSMIKYATKKQLTKPITVIYSNRAAADVPFKAELDELDKENEHLEIHYTFTQEPNWTGKTGRIDETMIKEILGSNLEVCEYYICGVPAMVDELRRLFEGLSIPKEQVHFEHFTGY